MTPLSWTIKPVIKMVFITLYSKKMPQPQPELELKAVLRDLGSALWTWLGRLGSSLRALFTRSLLVLPLLLIQTQNLSHAQTLSAPGVQVSEFKLERQDDAYVLSSTLSFELPQAVEDALSKGIALYFMAEVQVAKERWYWYDKYLSKQERYYRLSYNPLSRRWRLATSSKPINTSGLGVTLGVPYDSLGEALSAIKRSGEWRVVEASEIEPGGKYRLDYQFKLDLTQFPRPFQIGTLGESDWSMSVKRSQALVYESSKSP
jgi:hypothetical protein